MATPRIKKRGDSWSALVDLPGIPGERKQKRVTGKTKKEVEQAVIEILSQVNRNMYFEPCKDVLADYLKWWLDNCSKQRTVKKTYERYGEIIRDHLIPELGHIKLALLEPIHIQTYYAKALEGTRRDGKEGGLSPTTVKHHHALLSAALSDAVRFRKINSNPAQFVKSPQREKHRVTTLNSQELKALLKRLEGTVLYMPAFIAANTGMRLGEVLGLRWQDVDLVGNNLTVCQTLVRTKSGLEFGTGKTSTSNRTIAISQQVAAVMRSHKAKQAKDRLSAGGGYEDHDLVCARTDGRPMSINVSSNFRREARKMGFLISFHDLRHSHATLLMQAGVNPKVVSERLGHAGVAITLDLYSHVMPSMQEQAVRKFEELLNTGTNQG